MNLKHGNFFRALALSIGIAVAIGTAVWQQTTASPVAAQGSDPGSAELSLQIVRPENQANTASAPDIPTFEIGDTFEISVVAQGLTGGVFGSQFDISYDPAHLQPVEGSLSSGEAMKPVVVAVSSFDEGVVSWAASRQGDLDNLRGDVVLATITIKAIGATEPPAGQMTTIDLDHVKLGAKGGIEVPVSGLVPLDLIIRDDGTTPGDGDIIGKVKVEGRAPDRQAGHTIVAVGDLGGQQSDDVDANGDFFINNASAETYTLTADSPGFLAATCEGVPHTVEALTTLIEVTLLAGDINDDHKIDIIDAVGIGAVFGSSDPAEVANLNADAKVDILDLILMAANFGQTSGSNPWRCQS